MGKRICRVVLLSAWLTAAFLLPVRALGTEPTETLIETTVATVPEETAAHPTEPVETIPATQPEEIPESTEETQTIQVMEPDTAAPITPIDQLSQFPSGTRGICLQGTVVLVKEQTIVVQDASGGLRLTLEHPPEVGDILRLTVDKTDPLTVNAVTKEGTGALPLVELPLSQVPEALRISVKNAVLRDGILSQGSAQIPASGGTEGTVDVTGVVLDGVLYIDGTTPVIPPSPRKWNVYFGLLHAQTAISDGWGTPAEAFARAGETMDFFAVTDHSDSFDNADSGSITADGAAVSSQWAAGKQAAAAARNSEFVGLFGYEMSWGEDKALGHINTFRTPGWQTPQQPEMNTLAGYFHALAQVPQSVSQFNHPGIAYGDFRGFREYEPNFDRSVQLLEIEGESGHSYYDAYVRALDTGWHVAPTAGSNTHDRGTSSVRTAVLAETLSEESLFQALQSRRVYATQDSDFSIEYTLNGNVMGSVMGIADTLEAHLIAEDPTDTGSCTVEVISSGGTVLSSQTMEGTEFCTTVPVGYPYYFLRITQADGDIAVTAPVWVDSFTDLGIQNFSADAENPKPGQTVNLTLELYNHEEFPFQLTRADLLRGDTVVGTFSPATDGTYRLPFLWTQSGEIRLTVVVSGTINGENRRFQDNLTLHYQAVDAPEANISQVRNAPIGEAFRISGYATSGNTNPNTTFPDTIYVQDSSGGIAVRGQFPQDIQIGTPLDITGVVRQRDNAKYLELIDCKLPKKPMYRYIAKKLTCKVAADYAAFGGTLVQVEGTVTALTPTANGKGLSRLSLRDDSGATAVVVIDPEIQSGANQENLLASNIKKDRTVRAAGLLHREVSGEIVLRVRNCDEVVYVPPAPDPTNPRTGDFFLLPILSFFRR